MESDQIRALIADLSTASSKLYIPDPQYYEQIRKIVVEAEQALKPVLEQYAGWLRYIGKIQKRKIDERRALLSSGWWYAPSLMSLPAFKITSAVDEFNSGDTNAIDNFILSVFSENEGLYLKEVVSGWKNNKLFSCWSDHLNDGLDAHLKGKYTLSIPVLLLVAEGIATRFCKENSIYNSGDKSKGGIKINKAVSKSLQKNNDIFLSDLDIFESAILKNIYGPDERSGEIGMLNRHAVMHGLNSKYSSEISSLRCFMLLDMLSKLD